MTLHNLSRPTFHVPFSCQPLLSSAVWLCKTAGGFSCRSVLGTLLLRLQAAIVELEMKERAFRTLHSRLTIKVAMFELELRERASRATFCAKTCIAAGAGAAAGMHFAYNALRAPLMHLNLARFQPQRCGSARRVLLLYTICGFAAAPLAMLFTHYFACYLKLAICQPELRE